MRTRIAPAHCRSYFGKKRLDGIVASAINQPASNASCSAASPERKKLMAEIESKFMHWWSDMRAQATELPIALLCRAAFHAGYGAAQQGVERTSPQEEPLRDDEFSSWDDDPGFY
jgi:hypothetical protein